MKPFRIAVAAILLTTIYGCPTPKTPITQNTPSGFARYYKSDNVKAISSDNVYYRVRTERNYPPAKLDFWKDALKNRMLDAGYHFLAESEISANNHKGYLIELTAPLGDVDYAYFVAIFVKDEDKVRSDDKEKDRNKDYGEDEDEDEIEAEAENDDEAVVEGEDKAEDEDEIVSEIIIVESAGEILKYKPRKQDIIDALKSLSW